MLIIWEKVQNGVFISNLRGISADLAESHLTFQWGIIFYSDRQSLFNSHSDKERFNLINFLLIKPIVSG